MQWLKGYLRGAMLWLSMLLVVGCTGTTHMTASVTPPPTFRLPTLYLLSYVVGMHDALPVTTLSAYDVTTGQVRWQMHPPGAATAIAARDGQVYVATSDAPGSATGHLWAIDARAGQPLWSAPTGKVQQLVGAPGRVLLSETTSATSATVLALAATTGAKVWSFTTPQASYGIPPVVVAGMVITATALLPTLDAPFPPSAVVALDLVTGRELWRQRIPALLSGLAADAQGIVLAGSTDPTNSVTPGSVITDLRLENGQTVWQLALAGSVSPPALDATGAYVSLSDATGTSVLAVERATGKRRWQAQVAGVVTAPFNAPCALAGDLVVVSTAAPQLPQVLALRARDGATAWRRAEVGSPAIPLIWNATVIATLTPGMTVTQNAVEALDLLTGTFQWQAPVPGTPNFAIIIG